jgi:glycosyltransferase involved in cell wall biosynthesis
MSKIRLLIAPSDPFGVGHFRSIWPTQEIQKYHSDDFDVDIRLQQPITDDDLEKYDIVHFHRRINEQEKTVEWIKKFQDAGVVVVSDIDDYWMPFHGHPARNLVLKNKIHYYILESNKAADYITTTTEIYARHLRKATKNTVHIIPNAIDTRLTMWQSDLKPSDRVRVAWIGGSSHERDLDRIKGTFNKVFADPDIKDKVQVVMCGYDTRGTMTEVNPETGEEVTRKITPEESIWNNFEDIFNDFGKADKDQYVRRNTLPITQYGKHYNYCDICLAPLDQHTFNECKSELKLIETGMMGKALIASDLYMYKELLIHGHDAMLIYPRKDHKLWFKYIKELILNEELRLQLAKNLRELVYPKYTLENVTNERCAWYKSIVKS